MAAKKKPKPCECFQEMNKALEEHNTRIDWVYLLSKGYALPLVSTSRIRNLRDNKRAKQVVATYCPFCGKKFPE